MNRKVGVGAAAAAVLLGATAFAVQPFLAGGGAQGKNTPTPSAVQSQTAPAAAADQGQAALGNEPQVAKPSGNNANYTKPQCTAQFAAYKAWWLSQKYPTQYQAPSYGASNKMVNLYNGCLALVPAYQQYRP